MNCRYIYMYSMKYDKTLDLYYQYKYLFNTDFISCFSNVFSFKV